MNKNKLALFVALAGMVSAPAFAQKIEVPELDVRVYGAISIAIMHSDTGNGSEQYIVDNDYASTRVGGVISTELPDTGLRVGGHLEWEYQHNPSDLVTPENRSIKGEFNERIISLFVEGAYGKLTVGQGSGAADGATEVDLSGTKVASSADLALGGGALPFVEKSGGASPTVKQSIRNQDFESRYDRLRYDSPKFGPVSVAVSQGYKGEQDITELAVSYSGNIDGLGRLSASAGYSTKDVGGTTGDQETIGGSVSWLHDTGINLGVAYSNTENDDGRDSDFNMFKIGYKTGKHAFTVHRAQGKDFNPVVGDVVIFGSDVKVYGTAYVYRPIKRLETYAVYNNFSLDADSGHFDDVHVVMVGSRLSF
ncbi:porin [Marinobacter sp.]|uniref:porin n=1 Tax=Marinobacter sp. TaxID=50741 RepID=UPI0019F7D9D6|nr:porin [Marinobacter sp.]MBE0487136.1 porin [Marinobacter sp.]